MLHCVNPTVFPLYDQHVYRAFRTIKAGTEISVDAAPKEWAEYVAYRNFFREIIDATGLDFWTADRALWTYGRSLKRNATTQPRKQKVHSVPRSADGVNDLIVSDSRQAEDTVHRACALVEAHFGRLPFRHRGIKITSELVRAAVEILDAESSGMLPQNCRNLRVEETPDGLDRRIKLRLGTDLRRANIISDVLAEVGVVEVSEAKNPSTGRFIKCTQLRSEWRS